MVYATHAYTHTPAITASNPTYRKRRAYDSLHRPPAQRVLHRAAAPSARPSDCLHRHSWRLRDARDHVVQTHRSPTQAGQDILCPSRRCLHHSFAPRCPSRTSIAKRHVRSTKAIFLAWHLKERLSESSRSFPGVKSTSELSRRGSSVHLACKLQGCILFHCWAVPAHTVTAATNAKASTVTSNVTCARLLSGCQFDSARRFSVEGFIVDHGRGWPWPKVKLAKVEEATT